MRTLLEGGGCAHAGLCAVCWWGCGCGRLASAKIFPQVVFTMLGRLSASAAEDLIHYVVPAKAVMLA